MIVRIYVDIAEALGCGQDLKPTMLLSSDLFMTDTGLGTLISFLNDDFDMRPITWEEARQWRTVEDVMTTVNRRME